MVARLIPLVLASLLIAAHFFRSARLELVVLALLFPLLLLVKQRWSLILVQIGTFAAAAVWLFTAAHLVMVRTYMGKPWTAASIILGSVALFTIFAGALLSSRAVKSRYPSRKEFTAESPRREED
jgi:hypothetical protein